MKHMVVIGGGMTGVTSAYALVKQGFQVTLVDKNRYVAMETSYANGGQLSASNAEVWNHPSTLVKGIKWMLFPDAPLLVNPKPNRHKFGWMAEFVAAIRQYERNTVTTTRLAIEARQHLLEWAASEGIDFDLKQQGILHIYRNHKDYNHAAKVNELLAKGGLKREAVTPQDMQRIEPTLQGEYVGGFYTESDSSGDIHRFTSGLAAACERLGVRFLTDHEVVAIRSNGQTVTLQVRHQGELQLLRFDGVVISAGVHSRSLAAQLGDRVNVYPVKGYSITVHLDDEISRVSAPNVSLLDDQTKIVSSRLGVDRFRVAGTAEFNGYNLDIRADRIRPLERWVSELFPGVSTRRSVPWAGLRPMMPNMMPRVGPGKQANVFYNTGHGHLGWTLGAVTAHQLAGHVQQWAGSRVALPGGLQTATA